MASVWKARQQDSGRIVAVKVLTEDISGSPEDVEAFYEEAKNAANLDHENIVTVFEAGCQANRYYYYVMEFVSGYDTGNWLKRKGKLREIDVLTIAESVAVALDYAVRTTQIIHCDIKPSNIMVDGDGAVRITDMGIARRCGYANMESITGTPAYMSPEQAEGGRELDARTDIYSLGASIYHLLAGEPLFFGQNEEQILLSQIEHQVPDIREKNSDVSEKCAILISKFLAKNREDRPTDWKEALEWIRTVLSKKDLPDFEEVRSTMLLLPTTLVVGSRKQKAPPVHKENHFRFWLFIGIIALVCFAISFVLAMRL